MCGVDNNCNEEIDEGVLNEYFVDADGDGYGDEFSTIQACEVGEGSSVLAGDCDDVNHLYTQVLMNTVMALIIIVMEQLMKTLLPF